MDLFDIGRTFQILASNSFLKRRLRSTCSSSLEESKSTISILLEPDCVAPVAFPDANLCLDSDASVAFEFHSQPAFPTGFK